MHPDALYQDANGDGLKDRTAFSFHTWAFLDGNVYDATLGPVLGVPRITYLRSTIDTTTAAERRVIIGAQEVAYPISLK